MLSKLNTIGWTIALSIIILGAFYISYLDNKNTQLEQDKLELKRENQGLTLTLEKRNNDVVALSRTKKELEASANKDTSGFDWAVNISDSPVINKLQEQCVSCPK